MEFNSLPVKPLRITSKFGPRNTGIKGASTNHKGIDLGGNKNLNETPILCVAPGHVKKNYWNNVRGWVVIVQHGEYSTLYQHLKTKSPIPIGAEVVAGQQIGIMGNSSATLTIGTHLHFELWHNGVPIDPEPFLRNIKEDELATMTEQELRTIIREEIKNALNAKDSKVSNWAKADWDKAKSTGVTDGTRPGGYTTREQVVVMLERMKGNN